MYVHFLRELQIHIVKFTFSTLNMAWNEAYWLFCT